MRESPESLIKPESKEDDQIEYPHVEALADLYETEFPGETENTAKVKELFGSFFEQEIQNIEMFRSEKYGVEFPYTSINVADLARRVYKEFYGKEAAVSSDSKTASKLEFVFGSFLTTDNGNPFTFVEEPMHQCVKYLPRALEDLKAGREPENILIYTLGSPTNLFGEINQQFSDSVSGDAFRTYGKLYAELIKKETEQFKGNERQVSIELFGISMGGGIAAMTGEEILAEGLADQRLLGNEKRDLPFLQIRSEVPVSLSDSKIKKVQIPAGFVLDVALLMATKPYNRKVGLAEGKFMKELGVVLSKRGMTEKMSDEQKKIKNKVIRELIFSLGKGLTLKSDTKLTKVYGLNDPTTYTFDLARKSEAQQGQHGGTLGRNLIKSEDGNVRTFGVGMGHVRPFFRPQELGRIKALVESLGK